MLVQDFVVITASSFITASALLLVALIVLLGVSYVVRRQSRRRGVKTRQLTPASREGDDLAYVYYANVDGINQLAAGLMVAIPTEVSYKEAGNAAAKARGLGVGESDEVQRKLPVQINFPALSRDIRNHVEADRLATDVAGVPELPSTDTEGASSHTDVAERKRQQLESIARAQHLLLIRGHLQVFSDGTEDGPVTLEVTHLSAERFNPADGRGVGDAAAMIMPEGVAIRITLPAADAYTPSGRERFDRGLAFFGEVLAHSPTFDSDRGTFTCAAEAVWACPTPSDGSEEMAV